jgi:ABC-type transporter Mla subunit MlaD
VRRLALIATLLVSATAWVAASAGAEDTHTYRIELDNAFGIVEGSEVRVAGVTQGQVTDLDVNAAKRALLTVELSGPLSEFGERTTCSSEPQSLIAEYFIDCVPEGDPLPEGGQIPVEQTTQTVQPDLVQNTLREPYKRRLQLLINEFGTALAGNPENLNEAIRRGAPALREFQRVTEVLADQNRIIRGLNEDSDAIFVRLAERREDVVSFVQEARDTAAASADRREDLARDFNLLDDFLAELRPTMVELGRLARAQTPLLGDLRASAPHLNRLALRLPAFNRAGQVSLESLGKAGVVGRRALRKGRDEIKQLKRAGANAPVTSEYLADFLTDLDDPSRAVQIDARAGEDTGRNSSTPGTASTMGYTGLEGLLNYVYYQAGSLNQFDRVSHMLHLSLFGVDLPPCGEYHTGGPAGTVDTEEGGETKDPNAAPRCTAWLGPNQPRITEPLSLPRYDRSVCPAGSNAPELCDPNVSATSAPAPTRGGSVTAAPDDGPGTAPPAQGAPGPPPPQGIGGLPDKLKDKLPDKLKDKLPGKGKLPDKLKDQLPDKLKDQLPDKLPQLPGGGGVGGGGTGGGGGAGAVLDFLFGN